MILDIKLDTSPKRDPQEPQQPNQPIEQVIQQQVAFLNKDMHYPQSVSDQLLALADENTLQAIPLILTSQDSQKGKSQAERLRSLLQDYIWSSDDLDNDEVREKNRQLSEVFVDAYNLRENQNFITGSMWKYPDMGYVFNQPLIQRSIQELLKHKKLFRAIFTTERGSLYFIAQDGSCMRFKATSLNLEEKHSPFQFMGTEPKKIEEPFADMLFFKPQRATERCFFVSEETITEIKSKLEAHNKRFNQLTEGEQIAVSQIAIGTCPFELAEIYNGHELLPQYNTAGILDFSRVKAPAFHRGTPITFFENTLEQ